MARVVIMGGGVSGHTAPPIITTLAIALLY